MTAPVLPPAPRAPLQLATLGGTALEAAAPEAFMPPAAGACLMGALVILAWAAARPREKSVAAPRVPAPGRGRSQPFDEVLLAECA